MSLTYSTHSMKAYEMFSQMSPVLSHSIVGWLRDSERNVYRTALDTLAQQRKLRPIFINRKNRVDQAQWLIDQLRLRSNEAVGENLLQIWLMKGRSSMLAVFLDKVGVAHDGHGGVDGEIPTVLDESQVEAGAAALLEKHPAEEVAVYLQLFQLQQPGGWAAITSVLEKDARLKIGAAA